MMKNAMLSESRKHRPEYVFPKIAIIELASDQVLCGSDWDNGSIVDNEDNWNTLPSL